MSDAAITRPVRSAVILGMSIVVITQVGVASAQTGFFEGTWGNEPGCMLVRTGEANTDETFILRPAELERHESICEFVDVKPSKLGPLVIRALCAGEGSYWTTDLIVSRPSGDDSLLLVSFGDPEMPGVAVQPCE